MSSGSASTGSPGPSARAPVRIAMWSGPRNLSTALMRSFEARGDAFVTDEPLYAHYLAATGVAHPGAEEVIATHDADWRRVVAWLTGPVPGDQPVWYQKHMTHHLLVQIDRDWHGWLGGLAHAFLLRDPRDVIPSLDLKFARPRLVDTGLPQQLELFELVRARTGRVPPVIDSADLLRDPPGVLAALCAALGIEFTSRMLSWPPGRRATDGVWAKHWYASVERSTGFGGERKEHAPMPAELEPLHRECRPLYEALHAHRLRA